MEFISFSCDYLKKLKCSIIQFHTKAEKTKPKTLSSLKKRKKLKENIPFDLFRSCLSSQSNKTNRQLSSDNNYSAIIIIINIITTTTNLFNMCKVKQKCKGEMQNSQMHVNSILSKILAMLQQHQL